MVGKLEWCSDQNKMVIDALQFILACSQILKKLQVLVKPVNN